MIDSQYSGQILLDNLIHQWRFATPSEQIKVEQTLWQHFGQTKAVLILDMCGFSKTTSRQGIIAALAKIQQMNAIVQPTLQAYQGTIIKSEADNIFAIFDHPLQAIAASHATYQAVQTEGLSVAIGIGYGSILLIPGAALHEDWMYEDFFGDEVNLASKLGEDTATGGELWLTAAAYQAIHSHLAQQNERLNDCYDDRWEENHLAISGIEMTAYRTIL
ncbi:MAG: adenylate/guanylate cyclase domain-containing protein [Synechococcales bacterium]|nr:adenylate/guanylate cyclase domain-containing protein [Synechococcales bacterium]